MGSRIFRSIALYGGAIILGSVVVDTFRFTTWKDSHDILVPVLVLAGLSIAYIIGQVARSVLK